MKRSLLCLFTFFSISAFAQTWQDVGGGLNSSSHGMCLWNNMLVDAGSFGSPCGRVAGWDGTSWNCFGSGVGIVGRACVEFNNDLVVCGDFWNINQPCTGCNGIAKWDGVSWTALGTGFNNDVLCLTVWNGQLVAAGDFTTCDGNPCSRIARWTGTQWVPIGGVNDFNNDIRALAVYNGELWAGGDFTNVGGCTACDRIVKWDGTQWVGGNSGVDIPGGLDSTVRVLYVNPNDNKLYMGGHFLNVGGNTNCSRVAVYDGSVWSPLGTGVDSYVRAIQYYNGNIIVGGDFLNAGSVAASKIAKWNPLTSTWSAMGSGMNDYVKAMAVYNGELYAGGPFTLADGLPRSCVAKWYEIPSVPPTPAFTPDANPVCLGQCINFTDNSLNAPTSWSWTFTGASTTASTAQNPSSICYPVSGTYSVTLTACNAYGCNSITQTIAVSVTPSPTVTVAAAPSATICEGSQAALTAGGATSYSWSPSTGLSATTGTTVTASPSVTTTYTVTGTNGACSSTSTITVVVIPVPVVSVTPASAAICAGNSVTLTAGGAASYSWSPSTALSATTGASVTATPAASITYTVTGSDNGCTATATSSISVGANLPLPLVEGFQSAFLPADWTMIDDGSDGQTWQQNTSVGGFSTTGSCAWFPNNTINAPGTYDEMRTMSLNFASLSTAQMTFDVAYCRKTSPSGSDTLSVYVSSDCGQSWTPIYLAGGSTLATAPNQNAAFTPTAAQWRTETINLNSYIGQTSLIFAFRNHNRNGNNLYLDNINITGTTVNPPSTAFSITADTICPGGCTVMTDNTTGLPTSWAWTFSGGTPSSSTQQNPGSVCWSSAGTYTVTLQACNSNGCTADTKQITVVLPAASAGADTTICQNASATLHASGGVSYQWSPASGLSCTSCANPIATPVSTTTYVVTVTDAYNCSAADSVVVNVDICLGTGSASAAGGMRIYPNPFSTEATLDAGVRSSYEGMTLEIFNVFGQRVMRQPVTGAETKIDRAAVPAGLYFWKVSDANGMLHTGQMIVQ